MADISVSGEFKTSSPLRLTEGPNLIEVIASDLAGKVRTIVLTVIFTEADDGIIGRVTDVARPSPGFTVLTLDPSAGGPVVGPVTVEATAEGTGVVIPGREAALPSDISPGDFIALTARVDGARLQAIKILVKPRAPVLHAHITGSSIGQEGNQIVFMNAVGNQVTADAPDRELLVGQVATAVMHQDPATRRLAILDGELSNTKIVRLAGALEGASDANAVENTRNLGNRMQASVRGHLTTLRQILNRVGPDIKGTFTEAMERFLREHGNLLASHDLGPPAIKLTGVIADIDPTRGTVLVTPQEGPQVELKLTDDTEIRLFGKEARAENLEAGQHINQQVRSIHTIQTNEAETLEVLIPALGKNLIGSLLEQAMTGELAGTVARIDPSVDPPSLVIRLDTGETVALAVGPATKIRVSDELKDLQDLVLGASVKVRHDPGTMVALNVDTVDERPDQAHISGVVNRRTKEASVNIASFEGETVTLKFISGSVIERDGMLVTAGVIRLGDLVRPTSRYNTRTGEIVRLVLRAEGPRITGIVRGTGTTPAGNSYITISTSTLDLVTLRVTDVTKIARLGEVASFEDVSAGDTLELGLFNLRTMIISDMALGPPKTLRIEGTITALDRELLIVTVSPAIGEFVKLLVPDKPGKITLDGDTSASFDDLEEGDQVLSAFYIPGNVVVRIIVRSQ